MAVEKLRQDGDRTLSAMLERDETLRDQNKRLLALLSNVGMFSENYFTL